MDYESRYKMQILTKEEMYRADRYTIEEIGISGYALMECAGQAMAMEIMKYINLETDRNYMQNKKRKPMRLFLVRKNVDQTVNVFVLYNIRLGHKCLSDQ